MKDTVRIRIISVTIILFFGVLIWRLYSIQIINGHIYTDRADRQYTSAPVDTFDRGSIFFKTKDGSLVSSATLMSGYYMAIIPKQITYPEDIFNLLSPIIDLDENDFIKKASKKDDPYEEIAHNLTKEQAEKITNLNIDTVRLYKEKWRFYPFSELAAQSIGFVAYDDDNKLSGRYGLERSYEKLLSRDEDSSKVNFFADIFLNLKESIFDSSSKGDLVTSIEPSVQTYLATNIQGIQEKYHSKLTGGIIMNPQNGEIYAMGVRPTFDLNEFSTVNNPDVFSNPLTERVYEMGSIIKPLTVAAGIDSGVITEDTHYNDTGSVIYNGSKISNYDGRARGDVAVQQILSQSLNVGASWVMEQIGIENFSSYFRKFGLGDRTEIDLPNESIGLISNLNSTRLVEHATASFGQGIAMTPIATVRSLSILANGGNLVTPHLGVEMKLRSGITKKIEYPKPVQVLKKETTDTVTRMLITVVDESLKNGDVKLKDYTIGAKTGTAQIADNVNGGYYDDKFLHSFFGYFPARNPKFLVFLFTVEPKDVSYASETLTDSFMDIAKFLLNYYEVAPDRQS